jgi:hypothetical protein
MGEEQTLPLIPLMTLIYTDMKEPDFTHRTTSRVIGEAKAHRGDAEAGEQHEHKWSPLINNVTTDKPRMDTDRQPEADVVNHTYYIVLRYK